MGKDGLSGKVGVVSVKRKKFFVRVRWVEAEWWKDREIDGFS